MQLRVRGGGCVLKLNSNLSELSQCKYNVNCVQHVQLYIKIRTSMQTRSANCVNASELGSERSDENDADAPSIKSIVASPCRYLNSENQNKQNIIAHAIH